VAEPRPKVILIAGPTASGKSALALSVASEFEGVVINADSQQRYRGLPILTAQPSATDMARVRHRLFGDLAATESGSAADWAVKATTEIRGAHGEGRLPIVVGGTGLYLRALTDGLADIPEIPAEVRAEARALMNEIGNGDFHARLAARDPEGAARIAPGDTQRLLRAWEVVEATDVPLCVWQRQGASPPITASYFKILLLPPRAALNAACDARFQVMMARGALAEVAALLASGIGVDAPIFRALGARELAAHLAGTLNLAAATAAAQAATRRYAKRQVTWFKYQFRADLEIDTQFSEHLSDKIFPNIRRFLLT
jgi:tRNA dimethylallyltransferase